MKLLNTNNRYGWLSIGLHWLILLLIAENKDFYETLKTIHGAGAAALFTLMGLHAVAALYHHYFVRDNALRRMLP